MHVTVVFAAPTKWLPDAGEHTVLLMPELSDDEAENTTVAYDLPVSGFCTMLLGQLMFGLIVSITVTVKVHVERNPNELTAVQVAEVEPSWNVDGDVGLHDVETLTPTTSDAEGV